MRRVGNNPPRKDRGSGYKSAYRARKRRDTKKKRIRQALFAVLIAVFLYSGIRLIVWRAGVHDTTATNEQLQAQYQQAMQAQHTDLPQNDPTAAPAATPLATAAPEQTPEPVQEPAETDYQFIGDAPEGGMADLLNSNADLVGWLKIQDVVNLPVVYRDNEYYLTHDFYGKEKSSGTLFLDENHPFTARTQHLVIHGHNMYDGNMFGKLVQYRKKDFGRSHGVIRFQTLYREDVYLLVAVAITPSDVTDPDFIPFLGTPVFQNEQALQDYIDQLDARGLYHFPIDVNMNDALLTMSTCIEDDRLILFCRRVRDGETQQDIQDQLNR